MAAKDNNLSVIIVVHDEAEALRNNLPAFLTQRCAADCKVIVVDDTSADETPDVLKRMKADYPNLYTTFLPKSIPGQRRKRLALSIGVKAARTGWVALADIKRPPRTDSLYASILQATALAEGQVMMVYNGRNDRKPARYQWWDEPADAAPLLRKAGRRTAPGNRGRWLKPRRGIYDLVVVPHAKAVETLKYYDTDISWRRLFGLRLHVIVKNLLNATHPFDPPVEQ